MQSGQLFKADILHFLKDPGLEADPSAWEYIADGALLVTDGKITDIGTAHDLCLRYPNAHVTNYSGKLIMPGFVDTHIHYAQTDVIASYGTTLLDWLTKHTFPVERLFSDPDHASTVAEFFLDELIRNGTTTASVFPTVHKNSVDAFFHAAGKRNMRMLCGKVMMDRHCPSYLQDNVKQAEEDNRALIEQWHGKRRLGYSLTPRFAPTSSKEQLAMTGRLFAEYDGLWLQSHLAENTDEIRWVQELFPDSRSYLDVYDHYGLLGERTIYAHSVHLDQTDRHLMGVTGTSIAFCPTSNLFLGSGFFNLENAASANIRIGMASDVGGGTSFSMFRTLSAAYKVLQFAHQTLNPWRGLYLATLGGARALYLDEHIGNFAIGKEADFNVIDFEATPLLARRSEHTHGLDERLFALMVLADDRAIAATYIMGRLQ
ncbi:guanine deaminase [Leeia oryzae]|uniref:guanine deaminase n=1 Tax=Leeia oryzae TaxID=356662 RepID=UPI0003786853|nr:guanine deaminase [Leeia oryzae]